MKTQSLIVKLGKKYPKKLQEWYDHCGLQTGKLKDETKTILLCLDFDSEVYDYLEKNNLFSKVDLIITHHPFIFGKSKKKVFARDPLKELLCQKIDLKNIPIVSYHTCFDSAVNGMNDTLSEKLGLINVRALETAPMARGGELPFIKPLEINEFAKYAKEKLGVDYGLLINCGTKFIKNVAIIGGAGSGYFRNAQLEGYDIYISGDAPHHVRREVVEARYNYLDLPHEIEKAFMSKMKEVLLSINKNLNIIILDHEKLPKVI